MSNTLPGLDDDSEFSFEEKKHSSGLVCISRRPIFRESALIRDFLGKMQDERQSTFLTGPTLRIGKMEELTAVVRGLSDRGFGWFCGREALDGSLPAPRSIDELYNLAQHTGSCGLFTIRNGWTNGVGASLERRDGVYVVSSGILVRGKQGFWLTRSSGMTIQTNWLLVAPREKP